MKKSIFGILKDKSTIITSCVFLIPAYADWYEIIKNVAIYSNIILFAILLMVFLLLYQHFFYKKHLIIKKLGAYDETAELHSSDNQFEKDKNIGIKYLFNKKYKLKRILINISFGLLLLIVSSFIYLKNKTVYYIVIQNNLKKEHAIKVMNHTNEILRKKSNNKFHAIMRFKSWKSNTYMVCLNAGYLSLQEANIDYNVAKNIIGKETKVELKGSSASLYRKIQYLKAHSERTYSSIFSENVFD
jgi:hypothetical protein